MGINMDGFPRVVGTGKFFQAADIDGNANDLSEQEALVWVANRDGFHSTLNTIDADLQAMGGERARVIRNEAENMLAVAKELQRTSFPMYETIDFRPVYGLQDSSETDPRDTNRDEYLSVRELAVAAFQKDHNISARGLHQQVAAELLQGVRGRPMTTGEKVASSGGGGVFILVPTVALGALGAIFGGAGAGAFCSPTVVGAPACAAGGALEGASWGAALGGIIGGLASSFFAETLPTALELDKPHNVYDSRFGGQLSHQPL